jgi:hypothetical protein
VCIVLSGRSEKDGGHDAVVYCPLARECKMDVWKDIPSLLSEESDVGFCCRSLGRLIYTVHTTAFNARRCVNRKMNLKQHGHKNQDDDEQATPVKPDMLKLPLVSHFGMKAMDTWFALPPYS